MNETGEEEADPPLSALCDPMATDRWNAAWRVAHVKLHGTAFAKVTQMLGKRGESLVDDLYMTCVIETRRGLEQLRNSPDRSVGKRWKELREFRDLRNMFAHIVECRTKDYLRKHSRETDYEDVLDHPEADDAVARHFEWQQAFDAVIGRLPPKLREPLVARVVKGLETPEVMRMCNASEEAINTRISRAKEKLREILERNPELAAILWPKQPTRGTIA